MNGHFSKANISSNQRLSKLELLNSHLHIVARKVLKNPWNSLIKENASLKYCEGGNNQKKKSRMCAKYIGTKKIDQFVEITKTTKSVALEYLQIYDGNVQLAIDDFYLDIKLKSIFTKSQTRYHDKNCKFTISTIIRKVCGCLRRTLRKYVRCACGCGRKSAHTNAYSIC